MRSVKTDSLIWRDNLLKNWRKLVWLLSVISTAEATPRCKWHFWAWLRGVIDSSRFCAYANISAKLKPYSNILHSIWVRDPDEFEPLKKGIKNLVTLSLYFKLSNITTTNQIRHSEGGILKYLWMLSNRPLMMEQNLEAALKSSTASARLPPCSRQNRAAS